MQIATGLRRVFIGLVVLIVLLVLPGAWLVKAARMDDYGEATSRWTEVRDTVGDIVLPLFMHERTKYAVGYREEKFRALKLGASEATVRSQLGEPLDRRSFPDGRTIWYYSEQATGTDNYLQRNLTFDSGGRLVRKYSRFYVD